jgi:hypothetical protein
LNSSNSLPSAMRAITSRISNGTLRSADTMPSRSSASSSGSAAGPGGGPSFFQSRWWTISRAIRRQSRSSSAR